MPFLFFMGWGGILEKCKIDVELLGEPMPCFLQELTGAGGSSTYSPACLLSFRAAHIAFGSERKVGGLNCAGCLFC